MGGLYGRMKVAYRRGRVSITLVFVIAAVAFALVLCSGSVVLQHARRS